MKRLRLLSLLCVATLCTAALAGCGKNKTPEYEKLPYEEITSDFWVAPPTIEPSDKWRKIPLHENAEIARKGILSPDGRMKIFENHGGRVESELLEGTFQLQISDPLKKSEKISTVCRLGAYLYEVHVPNGEEAVFFRIEAEERSSIRVRVFSGQVLVYRDEELFERVTAGYELFIFADTTHTPKLERFSPVKTRDEFEKEIVDLIGPGVIESAPPQEEVKEPEHDYEPGSAQRAVLSELNMEIEELKTEKKRLQNALIEYEELNTENEKKLTDINREISSLLAEIGLDLRKLENLDSEELICKLGDAFEEYNKLVQEKQELEDELANFSEILARITDSTELLEKNFVTLQSQFESQAEYYKKILADNLAENMERHNHEVNIMKAEIEEILAANNNEVSGLKSEIEKILATNNNEVNALKFEIEEILAANNNEVNALKSEIEYLVDRLHESEKALGFAQAAHRTDVGILESIILQNEDTIKQLQDVIKEKNALIIVLENKVIEQAAFIFNLEKRVDSYQKRIQELETENELKDNRIKQLIKSETENTQIINLLEIIIAKCDNCRNEYHSLTGQLDIDYSDALQETEETLYHE